MKAFGARASGQRLARMQASAGWVEGERGSGFRNRYPVLAGLRDASAPRPSLSDFLCHAGRRTPPGPLPLADPRPLWSARPVAGAGGLQTTWLGHSTVLIELDGATLLTDPVWGPRASPTRLAGPKRFHPAPLALKTLLELRRPSAVLLSHDHYDHLDMPTVRELARAGVPFITSLGVGAHLEAFGVPAAHITELDWWESSPVPGTEVVVTAAPSQHFSGRSLNDRNATLWSSFAVRGPEHALFFSGDTGLTPAYQEIAGRLGPFDLVLLEVGAHHPSWGDVHLGPLNALQAAAWLGAAPLLPVHWSTFSLALHAWDEPAELLLENAGRFAVPLVMPRLGEVVDMRRYEATDPTPWWRAVARPRAARPAAAPSRTAWNWPSD